MSRWVWAPGALIAVSLVRAPTAARAEPKPAARAEPKPAAPPGKLSGSVRVLDEEGAEKKRSPVVVYLENVPGALKNVPKRSYSIAQKNEQFSPSVLVVTKGSRVAFPNGDKVFHNVFSLSRAARFDLGLYKSGSSKSVKMRREGVVDVYCNIHPQMVAKVLVLETKYHATIDEKGGFVIEGVPAGTYPVVGWQPHGEPYRGQVTIEPGKVTSISFEVREGRAKKRHLRKDGTPYGRYQ